jgi:hypothetical protein
MNGETETSYTYTLLNTLLHTRTRSSFDGLRDGGRGGPREGCYVPDAAVVAGKCVAHTHLLALLAAGV